MNNNTGFGPKNEEEELVFAEERARFDAQMEINQGLRQFHMNEARLAAKMGVRYSKLKDMLSDDGDLTVRALGRIRYVFTRESAKVLASITEPLRQVCPDARATSHHFDSKTGLWVFVFLGANLKPVRLHTDLCDTWVVTQGLCEAKLNCLEDTLKAIAQRLG